MQEFYNLSQACDYLNENYPSVNFNTQKLLHKIAELDTPAYFYFSGCHTLAWYNTNFIDDSLTETEKHQIENAIERIFSALLDPHYLPRRLIFSAIQNKFTANFTKRIYRIGWARHV